MSEDPIDFEGKDFNLYRYGLNNPLAYRDPTGKFGVTEWIALAVIMGVTYYIVARGIDEKATELNLWVQIDGILIRDFNCNPKLQSCPKPSSITTVAMSCG